MNQFSLHAAYSAVCVVQNKSFIPKLKILLFSKKCTFVGVNKKDLCMIFKNHFYFLSFSEVHCEVWY